MGFSSVPWHLSKVADRAHCAALKTEVLKITGVGNQLSHSASGAILKADVYLVLAAYFNAECSTTSCSYNLTIVDIEDVYQAHLHAGNSSVADGELHSLS